MTTFMHMQICHVKNKLIAILLTFGTPIQAEPRASSCAIGNDKRKPIFECDVTFTFLFLDCSQIYVLLEVFIK